MFLSITISVYVCELCGVWLHKLLSVYFGEYYYIFVLFFIFKKRFVGLFSLFAWMVVIRWVM